MIPCLKMSHAPPIDHAALIPFTLAAVILGKTRAKKNPDDKEALYENSISAGFNGSVFFDSGSGLSPVRSRTAGPKFAGASGPGKVFVGELSKVDATVKAIFVKGTEPNREMIFFYDDQTEVIGADEGVRGLTGNTGAQLKISYRDERGLNLATKIEIQPKKV